MLYDIKLRLDYTYDTPVSGGRHLIRVSPADVPGAQRVVASSINIMPRASEFTGFSDFFGTRVGALTYRSEHRALSISMTARVDVQRSEPGIDFSPAIQDLRGEIRSIWSVAPTSPHHFLGKSPRIVLDRAITDYAGMSLRHTSSVYAAAEDLCKRIHNDFIYDGTATEVDTAVTDAFALRRGVCQDFAHIMIAGLRGLGIPAGYVSGFLRTLPPEGQPRLDGADAMHAWVRVWCGHRTGWVEFDPTNAMRAGQDHITVGYGRDYADVSPIIGVLRSSGGHRTSQAVDVVVVS